MELTDYVAILRRRKAGLILTVILILAGSGIAAYSLPAVYRSQATILIERQKIPPDLVESTVTGYIDERLETLGQRRVMTHDNLWEIAQKLDLYPDQRNLDNAWQVTSRMRENFYQKTIDIETRNPNSGKEITATIAFKISYDAETPQLAQKVTEELAMLYLSESRHMRAEQAAQVSRFFTEEADRLNEQILEYEEKVASFKQKHTALLPDFLEVNRRLLETTQSRQEDNRERIRSLEVQQIGIKGQLTQLEPSIFAYARQKDGIPRIEELRMQLAEALQKYSEYHPDVGRLRHSIAALEDAPIVTYAPDNPAYITLRAHLAAIEADLDAERAKQTQLNQKLATYEQRLAESPAVERDYLALSRDYQNAVKKYQEVKDKAMAARLAEQLEIEQKAERFSLLEPASLPTTPERPNRLGIMLLGLALALVGGTAVAAVAEYKDHTIRGAKQLTEILQAPPLITIPYIENYHDVQRRHWSRATATSLLAVSMAFGLYAAHLYWMPLNWLWETLEAIASHVITRVA